MNIDTALSPKPAPFGSAFKNLRPEIPASNKKHMAYVLMPDDYSRQLDILKRLGAMHRLPFVAASMECGGVFIDIRQSSEPVPFPEHGEITCTIIGDREIGGHDSAPNIIMPARNGIHMGERTDTGLYAVSCGPMFYHQGSLRRLMSNARRVTVDCTGLGVPAVYLGACEPTAVDKVSTVLVETTEQHVNAWQHFVNETTTDCLYQLIQNEGDLGKAN